MVVSQQDEKSQHKNKAKALKILRSRVYEAEKRKDQERSSNRSSQIGTGDRSERIRTYNFPQGRVTDHRINLTLHKLDEFLSGEIHEENESRIKIKRTGYKIERFKLMEILQLINTGSKKLKEKNIYSHKLDAEILLSEVLNQTREKTLIEFNRKIEIKKISVFNKLIERRSLKEPIAYILKEKEFWSKKFSVDHSTLIPRPETELMVDKITKIFKDKDLFVLDIGTGTGCILLSILSELKKSKGIGIDISSKAIKIAKANSKQHKLTQRSKFFIRSLSEIYHNKFDLIVSNPPYIMRRY